MKNWPIWGKTEVWFQLVSNTPMWPRLGPVGVCPLGGATTCSLYFHSGFWGLGGFGAEGRRLHKHLERSVHLRGKQASFRWPREWAGSVGPGWQDVPAGTHVRQDRGQVPKNTHRPSQPPSTPPSSGAQITLHKQEGNLQFTCCHREALIYPGETGEVRKHVPRHGRTMHVCVRKLIKFSLGYISYFICARLLQSSDLPCDTITDETFDTCESIYV